MMGERALGVDRRADRRARGGEGDEEGVTLRIDLFPAMRGERGPQQALVLRKNATVLVAQPVQESR